LLRPTLFEASVEGRLLRNITDGSAMCPVSKYLNVTMRQCRKHDIPIVESDSELALFLVFGSECAIVPVAVRVAYTYTRT
jgi:hypothetical protein